MRDALWIKAKPVAGDTVLFRGVFQLEDPGRVRLEITGASYYQGWLNDEFLVEGPPRYALIRPEYESLAVELSEGAHLLAFWVQHVGDHTRMLMDTEPFLWCRAFRDESPLTIDWSAFRLNASLPGPRRINPILGWADARDTRLEPKNWRLPSFDHSQWERPSAEASGLPDPIKADLGPVQAVQHDLEPVASGPLATRMGYTGDDPPMVFFTRDLQCQRLPSKGRWYRYDLGRVRLGRPVITLDCAAGTRVEWALSESLLEGRVSPWIPLSSGPSCNLDRFIARGGRQTFTARAAKGGRFLELHVLDETAEAPIRSGFTERVYHAPTEAEFNCNDPLLERIWQVGMETYRACTEDALTDNPTRERGQWLGDAAAVGMEIASVGFHDLRLIRRSLEQAALSAREDGMVAGMSVGQPIFLPSYALLWAGATWRYFQYTGDTSLLESLWPAAESNTAALRQYWGPEGFDGLAEWNFLDWGYSADSPEGNGAVDVFYYDTLRTLSHWADYLNKDSSALQAEASSVKQILRDKFAGVLEKGSWASLGYHRTVLALATGLFQAETGALDLIENHYLSSFPNRSDAPRNDDPTAVSTPLITPWFSHFALSVLLENGRTDFALEQFRKCWGEYLLDNGRTTWMEVFDERWSHCHQWSGCPTWQLSRYLLGLRPRLDLGARHFSFCLRPGSLSSAEGSLPFPGGGWIKVAWQGKDDRISYKINAPGDLYLSVEGNEELIRIDSGQCLELRKTSDSFAWLPLTPGIC